MLEGLSSTSEWPSHFVPGKRNFWRYRMTPQQHPFAQPRNFCRTPCDLQISCWIPLCALLGGRLVLITLRDKCKLVPVGSVRALILSWRGCYVGRRTSSVPPHNMVQTPLWLLGRKPYLNTSYPKYLVMNPGKIKYKTLEIWVLLLEIMHTPKIIYYRFITIRFPHVREICKIVN